MSLFTTRVELHKASSVDDYNTLHKEMEKEGFTRTIKLSSETTVYHLPTAEYNYHSETLNSEQVLELAKKAATRTNKEFSVLVTMVDKTEGRRYWHNLTPAK
jgi:hypothetical protein